MQSQALPGFRDFYPEDTALRNHIFAAWRRVAVRYGFVEYDGPPLEPLKLYTDKSGAEIVSQLYNFEDKGGREVSLRPEMTPTLARMVAARAQGLPKPIKWFSIPQLFRYERQQRGRLREHFQLNVDLIGEASPVADAEVIAVAIDVLRELGLTGADFTVRMSDRRALRTLLDAAGVDAGCMDAAYQAIDKIERDPQELLLDQLRESGVNETAAQRVLDIARIKGKDSLEKELANVDGGTDAAAPLLGCLEALDRMGLGAFASVDCSIVRGLAYYTGIVFELFDSGGSMRAICGGGRYDGLTGAIGGVELPALGFGMGDVVLGELLKDKKLVPEGLIGLDAYIIPVDDEDLGDVVSLVHGLRDEGLAADYSMKPRALGKQLKTAVQRGARAAVMIGAAERAEAAGRVKDLNSGTETIVSLADIASHIGGLIDEQKTPDGEKK